MDTAETVSQRRAGRKKAQIKRQKKTWGNGVKI